MGQACTQTGGMSGTMAQQSSSGVKGNSFVVSTHALTPQGGVTRAANLHVYTGGGLSAPAAAPVPLIVVCKAVTTTSVLADCGRCIVSLVLQQQLPWQQQPPCSRGQGSEPSGEVDAGFALQPERRYPLSASSWSRSSPCLCRVDRHCDSALPSSSSLPQQSVSEAHALCS